MPLGIPNIATAGVKMQADFSGVDNQIRTGLEPGLKKIGGLVAGAFATGAVIDWGREAIKQASDLNESINAVNVTFGDAAEGILQLGEDAATAVGLSTSEFNSLAVSFSGFVDQIAGPGGDVVSVMEDLTTRAADFASVMNLDVNEAAEKFRSGLAGQSEPLRQFGIDISNAAVQAEALRLGLRGSGQQLTEQQKVLVRYRLIMNQTEKTAGDFANTSGDMANQQRILRAELENTQAEVGDALVPIFNEFLEIARDTLPVLEDFADLLGGLFGTIDRFADGIERSGAGLDGMIRELQIMERVGGFRFTPEAMFEMAEAFGVTADELLEVTGGLTDTGRASGKLRSEFGLTEAQSEALADAIELLSQRALADAASEMTTLEERAREAFFAMGEASLDFGADLGETSRSVEEFASGYNDTLREALRDTETLFAGAAEQAELTVEDFIQSLKEQAQQRVEFLTAIRDLEAQGLDDLAQALAEAGPEFTELAKELAESGTEAFDVEWLIEQIARQSLDNIQGLAAEYTPILETAYKQMGRETAQGFIEGYYAVNIPKAVGDELGLAIRQAGSTIKVGSPSQLTKEELGIPFGEGFVLGVEETLEELPDILSRYVGVSISQVQGMAAEAAAAGGSVGSAFGNGFIGPLSELPVLVRQNIQNAIDSARQTVRDAGFNPPPDPREAGTPGAPGRGFVEPTVGGRVDPIFQGEVVSVIDGREVARAVADEFGIDSLRVKRRAGEGTFWGMP